MTVLRDINRFLSRTQMPPSVFGRLAVGDPRLVHDLRRGRVPRAAMVARIRAFIARAPHDEYVTPCGQPPRRNRRG